MQPHTLIDLHEVTQRFRARVALNRFSLSIEEGTVVGVLGPNGAGKTTLIEVVAGLVRPVSGTVRWRGAPVMAPFPRDVRARIGVMTQHVALYDELSVRQNLRFAGNSSALRSAISASPRCSS